MSCRRARRVVMEYAFDELERGERALFESHLDGCPRCRRRVSGLRHLWRALPEPHPAGLHPPAALWERSWSSILEGIAEPPQIDAPATDGWVATGSRWSAVAAAIVAAFLLGQRWDDVRQVALRLAGLEPPAAAGYFSGLDSFQRASDGYLQRSRLLLLELQQTGAAAGGVDDPWLMRHSRGLLGEFPRQFSTARRAHNPQLEQLLAELEGVLRHVLDQAQRQDGAVPADLESDLNRLLFKLEMLELPEAARTSAAAAPTPL